MTGPGQDDDEGDLEGTRPSLRRHSASGSEPAESVPSLDDASALESLPDVDAEDSIPSLDDAEALTSLTDEHPAEAGAARAASWTSASAAPATSAAPSTSRVDERQVVTQIVARPPGLPRDDVTVVAPAPRAADVTPSHAVRLLAAALTAAAVVVIVVVVVVVARSTPAHEQQNAGPRSSPERGPVADKADAETAEAAWAALRTACASGDFAAARGRVAAAVWPPGERAPPSALVAALASSSSSLKWQTFDDGTRELAWREDAAVAGLGRAHTWTFRRDDGRWQVVSWQSDGIADPAGVAALFLALRQARDDADGNRVVALLVPGPHTCERTACAAVRRAVTKKTPHPLVDAVTWARVIDGSLRARDADGVVRVRGLRRTRLTDVTGVVVVDVARGDEGWKVVRVDTAHADQVDREVAQWQAEHAALVWRAEVARVVGLEPLPVTCARPILAWCAEETVPTRLKNLSRTTIRRVQVTKVMSGRGASSPWAIFTDVAAGAAVDKPTRTSSAPAGRGFEQLRSFDHYRVDWVELEGGRRLAPSTPAEPTDLAAMLAVRRAAGADVGRLNALRARVAALGYSDDEIAALLSSR
jgi:hypothetical protein